MLNLLRKSNNILSCYSCFCLRSTSDIDKMHTFLKALEKRPAPVLRYGRLSLYRPPCCKLQQKIHFNFFYL